MISRSRVPPDSCLEPVDVRGRRDLNGHLVQSHPFTDKGAEWAPHSRFLYRPHREPTGQVGGTEDLLSWEAEPE